MSDPATSGTSPGGFPPEYVPFQEARAAMPAASQVDVGDGVSLETVHRPGPDPALVFVHGGLGSLWNPYPQLAAFADERELVTYSLAGNGDSSGRPVQSVEGHVADLAGLLEELDVERPILHGHSYGTAIAIEYAKAHDVGGLVLHGGGDHDLTPAWEKPFLRLFLALGLYRLPVDDAVLQALATTVGFHEATADAVVADFLRSNPLPRRRSAWETVTDAFWGFDGRDDVERIDAPTLVVHGPGDGVVDIETARGTAGHIPEAVFCRLERTGHVGFVERPAAYNDLLRALVTAATGETSLAAAVRERVY